MSRADLTAAHVARVQALEQAFGHIGRTRMQGVPVQNSQLAVQTIGFQAAPALEHVPEALVGILLTPWFMNLVRLPVVAQTATQGWLAPGIKAHRALGCERFEFMGAFEDGLGAFEVCSLFSPMFEFADQASAVATATQVLVVLREPVAAPVASAQPQPSRRGFLFGRATGTSA